MPASVRHLGIELALAKRFVRCRGIDCSRLGHRKQSSSAVNVAQRDGARTSSHVVLSPSLQAKAKLRRMSDTIEAQGLLPCRAALLRRLQQAHDAISAKRRPQVAIVYARTQADEGYRLVSDLLDNSFASDQTSNRRLHDRRDHLASGLLRLSRDASSSDNGSSTLQLHRDQYSADCDYLECVVDGELADRQLDELLLCTNVLVLVQPDTLLSPWRDLIASLGPRKGLVFALVSTPTVSDDQLSRIEHDWADQLDFPPPSVRPEVLALAPEVNARLVQLHPLIHPRSDEDLSALTNIQGLVASVRTRVVADTVDKVSSLELARRMLRNHARDAQRYRNETNHRVELIRKETETSRALAPSSDLRRAFPWTRLPLGLSDDLLPFMSIVAQTWNNEVAKKLVFLAGRLAADRDVRSSAAIKLAATVDNLDPTTSLPATLHNQLRQAEIRPALDIQCLAAPVAHRRAQFLAAGGPAERLVVRAQRASIEFWALASSSAFLGYYLQLIGVAVQSTGIGVGLAGLAIAAWRLQGRWTKAMLRCDQDANRIAKGLSFDIQHAADATLDQSVLTVESILCTTGENILAERQRSMQQTCADVQQID
ncbi:uncharacterized protein L969DRAFT_622318 [Mixia osmundae IAM 14324]|uniref:Uncharacterized protein n=1 Tax=Mixia osmundae (strain CBS 9802 / IAM 14324 / JCM 22182 / KY 12970) TaxID=764103 RepID=G7E0R3_MIXOS|nr:uncharacterized protein L969DRAFT_622318 [Mixia osmundae IAM 14324]KEI39456.1 hypothetical protein L969DRAFT_622318 [Mixia osmundae IAM 14324]GAA96423.1 hypothetical protein E5Q_03090 [Mixia osmundae IAM 14324]